MSALSYLFNLTTVQSILVGLVVGYLVYYLIQRYRYKLPPEPFSWPLIGHLLEIQKKPIYKVAEDMSKVHGPVVTMKFGPISFVMLNRIDVVLEALVKRKADFAGRPALFSLEHFSEGFKDIVFADYGNTWKLHRKICSNALRKYMHGHVVEENLQSAIKIVVRTACEQDGPVNPHRYNNLLVFNVIAGMCFSQSFEDEDEDYKRMIATFDEINENLGNGILEDVIPLLKYWPTKKWKRFTKLFDDFIDWLKDNISKHVSTFDPDNIRDFTDTMIATQNEAEKEEDPVLLSQITDVHLRQTISDIFGAGLDTTRYTLDWITLYLAKYPELQKKVYDEIVRTFGNDKMVATTDRGKAPYTVAFIDEVMRMCPIVVLAIPHKALCDSTIGGYDIRKDTSIMVNIWALHMDSEQWKDPHEFNPDRFLDNGELTAKPESYLPFSAGRRVCLGEPLAKVNIFVMVTSILQKFEIVAPEGDPLDTEPVLGSAILAKPFKVIYKLRS